MNNILGYGDDHLLKDIWIVFSLDLLQIKLIKQLCPEFCMSMFLQLSAINTHNAQRSWVIWYFWLHFYFWILMFVVEKAMAPHSSTLAWKIPWTEEPVRLQSMGSLRVGNNWATSLSIFTFMHWRRKWQPTPVFLPGESQGRGSLVGCRLWGRTESDTTEVT